MILFTELLMVRLGLFVFGGESLFLLLQTDMSVCLVYFSSLSVSASMLYLIMPSSI